MPFFVFQVQHGSEGRLLGFAERHDRVIRDALVWPRRRLQTRRQGRWQTTEAPVFPGYLFLRVADLAEGVYRAVRELPGFRRFLPSNASATPLGPRDAELLSHFLSFGEVVGSSVAYFDADRRIRVVSGPLKGMEGRIVKVDRRKGRARVRLDLYDDSFLIDFGFQALEAAADPAAAT